MTLRFLRFVRFEIEQHILTKRWLLPVPAMLFIAYSTTGAVQIQPSSDSIKINTWDALFSVFANQNVLFHALTFLFLYLVSDFLPESGLGQPVLLRLGSRRHWWLGKVVLLSLGVILYLMVIVGIVAGTASFVLPWQVGWSEGALKSPEALYVRPVVLALPPAFAFGQLILLLALGWFTLGLFTLVAIQLSNNSIVGFIAGLLVVFSGMAALRTDLLPPFSYLFIHQHLLFNLHSFGEAASSYPPLAVSIWYWILWSVLLIGLGLRVSLRQDFLSHGVRS